MAPVYLNCFLPLRVGLNLLITPKVARAANINCLTWDTKDDGLLFPNQALLSHEAWLNDDLDLGFPNGTFNFSSHPATDNFTGDLENFLGLVDGTLDQEGDLLTFKGNFLTNKTAWVLKPKLKTTSLKERNQETKARGQWKI